MVVPVFTGLGICPSNRPSNSAFLEREGETGVNLCMYVIYIYNMDKSPLSRFIDQRDKQAGKVTFTLDLKWVESCVSNTASLVFLSKSQSAAYEPNRSSYLAAWSKLNPAAGAWRTFDSAIVDPGLRLLCASRCA